MLERLDVLGRLLREIYNLPVCASRGCLTVKSRMMAGMIGLPSASASSSSFSHSTEARELGEASRMTASHATLALRSLARRRQCRAAR
jgi:hypothetical protein